MAYESARDAVVAAAVAWAEAYDKSLALNRKRRQGQTFNTSDEASEAFEETARRLVAISDAVRRYEEASGK